MSYNDAFGYAGYPSPDDLPSFPPYLRAKYDMSDAVARKICTYFDKLKAEHGFVERHTPEPADPRHDLTWSELLELDELPPELYN
nr:hypothetical protein [Fodinicola acaciae]